MLNPRPLTVAETIAGLHRLLQTGSGPEAEAAARSLQRQHPARGDVNEALALILVNIGKPGEALSFAETATRAEPKNPGYLINLGRLYLEFELIEEASPMLEKAFRIDPALYQAPWALGEFFHKTGNGERAIRYLKQALAAARPKDRNDIEKLLADALSSLGEIDEAERRYQALCAFDEHRVFALSQIAGLRKHQTDSPMFATLKEELSKGITRPQHLMHLHLA
ncbi:MAG: tetratricopeptide repeat protein, partial [Aestuariivirga sp.]